MKICVTGGCGFIGSNLVEVCLEKGFDVAVIDNCSSGRIENIKLKLSQIEFIHDDLSIVGGKWCETVRTADIIIHLAALADIVPSIESPRNYFEANVLATLNLLEEVRMFNPQVRLIYAASSSCYGLAEKFPTPENYRLSPQYPYALSKMQGEELVCHWAKLYGLNAISLRFFNVYGPKSRTNGTYGAMFGVFLAQKLAGKPFTVVGDGAQTRDFTHVNDVCTAILAAARADVSKGEVFNVGSGRAVSINKIVELLGGDVVYLPKRPGEPDCTHADIQKIYTTLGWSPSISIEEGVQHLLENIDYWSEAPIWDVESISSATKAWFKFLN